MNRVPVALQRRSGTFRPPTLQPLPVAVTANVVEIRARTRSTITAVVKAGVCVVGVMGHLPLADRADPAANAPAVAGMHEAQQAVCAAGLGSPLAHLAATSGTVTDPATHFGMVRVGARLPPQPAPRARDLSV